ncbi:alkaline phosphatase family protein [Arthrospiribacter ruber]|nr:nucleotide pyrophosphatase/phosphodiesterase family protein [Arthrospiribacter ruber]
MKNTIHIIMLWTIGILSMACQKSQEENPTKTVVIIVDALRFDYVNQENTPNIFSLKENGVSGIHHHSTFPTVTRVNTTTYATGAYPKTHGILGNSIYLPEVDKSKGLNTGDARTMMLADSVMGGKLITSPSIGELISINGLGTYAVFSTGSTGQSYLLNHRVTGLGIINPDMILPESFAAELTEQIGQVPPRAKPNKERHKWITDAFIKYALEEDKIDIATIWYSDPDGTAHAEGIGSPMTMESIKNVDEQIGRILQASRDLGMEDRLNIIVSADHGFATHLGNPGIADFLIKNGLKKNKDSEDVTVVGNAIYLDNETKNRSGEIIESFLLEDWVGAIFVNPNLDFDSDLKENIFSFDPIHWGHPERQGDIYVDVNWNDEINEFGYKGYSYNRGIAGHGSSSPYEMKTPFLAFGPSFKSGIENKLPSGMVDLVPTVLYIHGLDDKSYNPDGRVLHEILRSSSSSENDDFETIISVKTLEQSGGVYELNVTQSVIGERKYLDFTKTVRSQK